MQYAFSSSNFDQLKFLSPLKPFFDDENFQVYLPDVPRSKIERKDFDGVFSIKGKIHGRDVAILYNDFRINGGSFGKVNSKLICSFLQELTASNTPLIFCLNTLGARVMEGRAVFKEAFNIFPNLLSFIESNLLITCSLGRCLGLGALFFELGDYRISLAKNTLLNLTGPEVMKLFFGKAVNFEDISSCQRQFEKNNMVNEICYSKDEIYAKARYLIGIKHNKHGNLQNEVIKTDENDKIVTLTKMQFEQDYKLKQLVSTITGDIERAREIFKEVSCSVHAYIINSPITTYGLFINPPGKANMIDMDTINKYQNSLRLFKKLGLPVISIVDTPGADPRAEQNDLGIVSKLNQLTADIIQYPLPKVGIVYGRCFGGASVLSFPQIFGGEKTYTVLGCQMGIMHKTIIKQLLSGSKRLYEQWEQHSALEKEDFEDLLASDVMQKLIEPSELGKTVVEFIRYAKVTRDHPDIVKSFTSDQPIKAATTTREVASISIGDVLDFKPVDTQEQVVPLFSGIKYRHCA
ncbi:MAG: hypothetical protein ISR65_13140 [Bacteriovoracaceae bacterium]|nr:hypothetical protein [Bacteriovoracaceae bacterium]